MVRKQVARNLFCSLDDLDNEASVEQFFVSRLLEDMGFRDSQIAPKASLEELAVSQGRRKSKYRPDYAIKYRGKVRWILDAKAVGEDLAEWIGQCASYCLELNSRVDDNPVGYYVLSNGVSTEVYRWDSAQPVLQLDFADFQSSSVKYRELKVLLGPDSFLEEKHKPGTPMMTLRHRSVSEINADFTWAHRFIYRSENLSYGSAFMEFVKVIFLKLLSDREIRRNPMSVIGADGSVTVPASEVHFSKAWIQSLEKSHPNPMDAIQFANLLRRLETAIQQGKKKRIFATDEHIRLSNETLKELAARFETTDLYGIDADLNGRMFETFLNATLRGKDLGQYFTPRSVAKLATQMAGLRATPDHTDVVLDACCGTGGFLIEALTEMWRMIDLNPALSDSERKEQKRIVAEESLFGIDIARDPALSRIARINMFLHGDGGSRIYQLDTLDKQVSDLDSDDAELRREKAEFRQTVTSHADGFADVVLTNPPFAKEYSRKQASDAALLDEYALGFETVRGRRRPVMTLRSSVMFLERYHDLLVEGGTLVSVVDDGILGGDSYRRVRDWLREHYLLRAVISLPGDAFQRSQARVKTSIVVLEKRKTGQFQDQPPVFMYPCTAVGVDDSPRQRVLPIDRVVREAASREINEVADLYKRFRAGDPDAARWSVPGSMVQDRMDVKAVFTKPGNQVPAWEAAGLDVVRFGDIAEPLGWERVLNCDDPEYDDLVPRVRVRYDGFAEAGDKVDPTDLKGTHYVVSEGDIVFSHINAIHGAVAVIPPELDGAIVTNEYTICRPKGDLDPRVLWALVRSVVARADLMILSTGIGRTRIDWDQVAELQVPLPSLAQQRKVIKACESAEAAERQARLLRSKAKDVVEQDWLMNSPEAERTLAAFKPPR
ncbi:N-6 DNA methylase [Kytococcus sedentarius]|uniref:N-6 DNA methylase n=1 Tax=Kytococcus sedentarius TaxID=1276 RepID=UPI000660C21E|nr:N-6 DNA methylase [Kytococcus sedentarius]